MSGLFGSLLLVMQIHATGDCPGAAAVERQLGPLLGDGTAARSSDVATLRREPDGRMRLALNDAEGRPIGDRQFPRAGTCRDQEETIAVTLAVWEAQIHPEISLHLERLSTDITPPVSAARRAEVTATKPGGDGQLSTRAALSLGVALGGDWQSGSWAPSGRVELGLGRDQARWRARLAVLGVAHHVQDVAPGQASWWRASLSLGADYDLLRGRRWAAVLGGAALGGVASISGSGYTTDYTSRSIDAGGEVRARGEWRPGRIRPWLGVCVIGWLRRQALELEGATTSSAALPRVQAQAALGADFVW